MQIIRMAETSQEKSGTVGWEKIQKFQERERVPGREGGFGLAVDIGTTTVVVSLYQLETKMLTGNLQQKNLQTRMGSDVVMRLMHCQRGHSKALQQMIIEQVEAMAEKLTDGVCLLKDIKKMAVVGNAAMCHIFAGQDISGLAGSPFLPAYRGSLECVGGSLGFGKLSHVDIYILPGIDAHVGADAVSMITTLGLGQNEKIQLAVDIGTNAELGMSNGHGGVVSCSVPAGPAFEGMEISCGMRGEPGAIAGVRFAPQAGNMILDVIGYDQAGSMVPKGVCGSGLIDTVAQLLQYGLVKKDGYLLSGQEAVQEKIPPFLADCLVESCGERGFILYQERDGSNGHVDRETSVVLTQGDIRQFQLAKAAVQAGIQGLLSSQGIALSQVENIWIAGVFGGHISKGSAVKTGLFPDVPLEKLNVVGNAAGEGAALALLFPEFCRMAEQTAAKAEHLELAASDGFQRDFLAAMELEVYCP